MTKETAIKLFEESRVRSVWDAEAEKWYISIVDVVQVLTESVDGRKYWNKLKQRLREEGNESVTNCHQLKLPAADGGRIAGNTRKEIEATTGKKVVSRLNAKNIKNLKEKAGQE